MTGDPDSDPYLFSSAYLRTSHFVILYCSGQFSYVVFNTLGYPQDLLRFKSSQESAERRR